MAFVMPFIKSLMERIFKKLNHFFINNWHLSVLDMNIGRWVINPQFSNIAYLKAENANGRHILIQPDSLQEPYYLLVDDANQLLIRHHHQHKNGRWKAGRMVVETSKNNYQVWIRSSRPLTLHEKRYWLKRLKSDPGADPKNRWGRCPGFRNRKKKYRNSTGGYPLSRLIWVDWSGYANIPEIKDTVYNERRNSAYRSMKSNIKSKHIFRMDYDCGNESATDFSYALALLRRGNSRTSIYKRILSERKNWKNHAGEKRIRQYLNRTIERAENIVNRS